MKILIILIFSFFGLVLQADPNLPMKPGGGSTFFDPTNPDCKPCQEILKTRQSFYRDMAGTNSPKSLGRFNPDQPKKSGLNPASGVKTDK